MQYINAAIFGIIQGITEFLPISSSGHLAILHKIIDLPYEKNELGFDVVFVCNPNNLHIKTALKCATQLVCADKIQYDNILITATALLPVML